jgi:hypothetical protein
MKVFVFDLLAYDANLDHLKNGGAELPYPLAKAHFDADTAMRTYEEHLDAWELLDRLGYDGVGFNEHHCSPYGLMNSPNLMAASAAQRTKHLQLLIYGNLLPLHEPLRLAEELAMLALHLLQVSLVYINTLMIQQVLSEPAWQNRLTAADLRALTPLLWAHVNPYGTFTLNMRERLPLEQAA